ncbi:hypothetical protein [Allorhodopirellula solitaria]|uniref:hypothetical protein n=1 Tax=Allorhodopirellula solitaria TaxID=2527987 RepID=UPI0011B80D28|nr:hypothetical protein [Allorhodopirellula solitaria]
MSRHRGRSHKPNQSHTAPVIDEMRLAIAARLEIDSDRIHFGPLEDDLQGRLGTGGDHWQIFYRDQWRELRWHYDGPLWVTRDLVRTWWG